MGLGILTGEFESLEFPSTVEVKRERAVSVRRFGLPIDDVNQCPLILGSSVRKNLIPVLGHLEKIGFQRSKLGDFVKGRRRLWRLSAG